MILKLKGADFSENNLGQVDVRQDFLPYTEAAILASGNTQMTPQQKSTLDGLFRTMEAGQIGGVMSKMRKVYLPIIAADVSKALVDYATDSFTIDFNLNSENWQLRNHGLVGLATGQNLTMDLNNPLTGGNYSCFLLRTEKMVAGTDDSTYALSLRGKTSSSKWLGMRFVSQSSNGMVGSGSYGADKWFNAYYKDDDAISAAGVSLSGTSLLSICPKNGGYEESLTAANVVDMTGETAQTLYVFGLAGMNMTKAYGVAMIGEALTEQQTRDIVSKINALYDAFNV